MRRGVGGALVWLCVVLGTPMSQAQGPVEKPAPEGAAPSGVAPQAAPAAGQRSAVAGAVLDASTALPIVGAMIAVAGQKLRTETDLDGNFRLSLPPGTYRLRVSADLYRTKEVTDVEVRAGEQTPLSVTLSPNVAGNVQLVEVVAAKKAAEETQLVKRKESAAVSETVGAETIAKSTDSDAGEVVTRVPSVSIKDGKFILIRGLNERYSSALLNGSRLPSTDPNRRIVPLDIFPADFIEALGIVKTYTPDLPGDFAGGLVDIELAEPPTELTAEIGVSMDFNTETTFQDYDTYNGTSLDWFALGADHRDLPSIFPDRSIGTGISTPQQRAYVGSLLDNWNVETSTAPPNFGIDGSVGNTWGPFGFNLAAVYGWKFAVHRNEALNTFGGDTFTYDHSIFEAQLGAVLTTQYTVSPDHKLSGRALVNIQGIDEVLNGSGTASNRSGQDLFSTATYYTQNQLGFGQLEGRHHWSLADLDWRAAWGPSSQDQPDSKYYIYQRDADTPNVKPFIVDYPPSTLRAFSTLNEFVQDYFVDSTVPFTTRLPFTDVWSGMPAKLKFGGAYLLRDRNFLFRQFRNRIVDFGALADPTLPPDSIFIPSNYSQSSGPLSFEENAFTPFEASQEVAGGYGMLDLPVVRDRLRFVGGSRLEYSYITTTVGEGTQETTTLNDLDPMPSANLIYMPRDDMNVRAGFSQTVSRPEFRELTPIQFPAPLGGRTLQGNQDLISTHITNWDLRWEWFFSPLELASISFFYKDLKDPIELVTAVETSNYIDLYVNAESATVWGFELEGRKDFGFLVPYARRWSWLSDHAAKLADLQLLVNVSVIESTVSGFVPPPNSVIAPIPGDRALQGQAPYVVNAALEYQHSEWGVFRLLYNTVGPTIVAAGTDVDPDTPGGINPDITEAQRNQLDFVWLVDVNPFGTPLTAKFGVENLLNDAYLENQGDIVTNNYRTGLTFKVGLSYSY